MPAYQVLALVATFPIADSQFRFTGGTGVNVRECIVMHCCVFICGRACVRVCVSGAAAVLWSECLWD